MTASGLKLSGVKLPVQAAGRYPKTLDICSAEPDDEVLTSSALADVVALAEHRYPPNTGRAETGDAKIRWSNEGVLGPGRAPEGHTPAVRVDKKREGLSVLSTVDNQGKVRWKMS